ncbi:DNA polymerase Y family protein [Anaerotalea alkaliphila]|uniref:DNA polymerase IV n=1 Tax=Anaerotalea alkaliphila TaxID=2662126 RepID=A0A7X5HVP0_9FIRM|nr:DNA polymerase IV [Anaerotalea alkaliphila]NDL67521.1 DNA polymerase IV [Anaerotalea alkaliphila]
MDRLIFHVDVNSAYLSWEAARRVAEGGEDLRLIPSAIGGDRDKRTGVILAKSIPAKELDIRTGEPVAMALQKCPDLFLARPDFCLYEKSSEAFMDICRKYAPVVEKYSIDECFLDMSGTGHLYPDPLETATRIKDEIRDLLGFTVNIGIGPNKLLAKMAGDFEKPDKVHTLFAEEVVAKLWPLPVGELFTVGRATAERLEKGRIFTIGDLAKADLRRVQALAGMKLGQQIHAYANGVDNTPVLSEAEDAKGYSISTTLEEDVETAEQGCRVLLALADSVASRMRADGAKAFRVLVAIRGNDFKNRSHQRKLAEPTDVTDEIYAVSKRLFAELWDKRTPLRLLGISLTDVTREGHVQQSLFPDENRERARKLDKAVDRIRSRFGSDTIVRGSALQSNEEVGKKYKAQMDSRGSEAHGKQERKE